MAELPVERRSARPDGLDLLGRRFFDWLGLPSGFEFVREPDLKVEEYVEDEQFVIRAELPGIDPEQDVQIHVRDHAVEVRAERKQETQTEESGWYRSEFRYGTFFRRVPLPPDADEHDVVAKYTDGILEIRMPVAPKHADVTKIEVTRG